MGRGKKKGHFDMEDDPTNDGWMTGPIGEATEEMDTREAGGIDGLTATTNKTPGIKIKPGPRGKRSSLQKKRKAGKLEKALAVADRMDAKAGRKEAKKSSFLSSKALWQSGKKKR